MKPFVVVHFDIKLYYSCFISLFGSELFSFWCLVKYLHTREWEAKRKKLSEKLVGPKTKPFPSVNLWILMKLTCGHEHENLFLLMYYLNLFYLVINGWQWYKRNSCLISGWRLCDADSSCVWSVSDLLTLDASHGVKKPNKLAFGWCVLRVIEDVLNQSKGVHALLEKSFLLLSVVHF